MKRFNDLFWDGNNDFPQLELSPIEFDKEIKNLEDTKKTILIEAIQELFD